MENTKQNTVRVRVSEKVSNREQLNSKEQLFQFPHSFTYNCKNVELLTQQTNSKNFTIWQQKCCIFEVFK